MALMWRLALLAAMIAIVGELGCSAFDFEVGGERGWAVPPSNNSGIYNQWASKNRFKIGDSLKFKYSKDSVMVVGEKEYGKCNAEQPILFSNNGETAVALEHSGIYYFISGLREHCQRGQKMIIKVLSQPEPPTTSPQANSSAPATLPPSASTSGAADAILYHGAVAVVVTMASAFFV